MESIKIGEIKYDDTTRIRKDLNETGILELMESFKNVGQITPIVITRNRELVAGRRRIEAARRLGWQEIRAEFYEELDPLTRMIVEYDENDKRHNLTWQENANAIERIHRAQHEADRAKGYDDKHWSISDTARSLGRSVGAVSEDLILAGALSNERIANRPSRRGALDTFKRERELILVRELARRRAESMGLGLDDSSSTNLTGGVIYNKDCRELLKSIAPESIDLVIIDPPWGIDFSRASQWNRKWVPTYDDTEPKVREMLLETFPLLYKVLKTTSHIYCFYPIQESQWWVEALTSAGFIIRQRPLIWFKVGSQSITDTYTTFLPSYESILWGFKAGASDIRRFFSRPISEGQGWPREPTLWHENSKPVDMLGKWIETSSEINEVVLDCFGGGGSTAAAAFSLGRYYISCELDPINYKKSVERLRALEERKEESVDSSS